MASKCLLMLEIGLLVQLALIPGIGTSSQAYDLVAPSNPRPQPGKEMKVAPFASGAIEANPKEAAALGAASWVDPNYKRCGPSCIYGKAKEALSLQLQYVISKRNIMDSLGPDDAKVLIGKFCYAGEPGAACKKRYMLLTDFWLIKARKSLANDDQQMYNLTSQGGDPIVARDDSDDDQKAANSTYIITVEELYKLANGPRAMEQLNEVKTNEDWIKALTQGTKDSASLEPTKDDFMKFRKIPRDPSDPSGATFEISDGFDQKAYDAAHKAWVEFTGQGAKKNETGLYATLKGREDHGATLRDEINQDRELFKQGDPAKHPKSDVGTLDLFRFKQSRVNFIKSVQDASSQRPFGSNLNKKSPAGQPMPSPTVFPKGDEQLKVMDQSQRTSTAVTAYDPTFIETMTASEAAQRRQQAAGTGSAYGAGAQDPSMGPTGTDLDQVSDDVPNDGKLVIEFPDP